MYSTVEPSIKPNNENSELEFGRFLANPIPGDKVVLTGFAGNFPDSDSLYELRDNLLGGIDLVSDDDRRWSIEHPEAPKRVGKINKIDAFDPGFFGIHYRQAENMEPMIRLFLERAIESIMDAGYNPKELEGSRTGVFVCLNFSESEKWAYYDNLKPQVFAMTGYVRSMVAHRLSYYLKLKGPSFIVDTACSSTLYALDDAYKAMRTGLCDNALVGSCQLVLHAGSSVQFFRLGVLSPDGKCKVFDQAADGYARAETIGCMFLQKFENSRRIYGTIVHSKVNFDGFTEQGINFPSYQRQKELFQDFYNECGVNPNELSYFEVHGTGTTVGDAEEVRAIDESIATARKTPLLIGSVKSNLGHSEPGAGMCSIAKVIIVMETGLIPPNLHYKNTKDVMKGILEGRLKVVSKLQALEDESGYFGVDSFGFGGANSHVLLQWNTKIKKNNGAPLDDIPRLVCVSGRTEDAVLSILNDVSARHLDAEYIWLLHQIFKSNFDSHNFRGYSLMTKSKEISRSYGYCPGKQQLRIRFNHLKDLKTTATSLLQLQLFRDFIKRLQKVLYKNDIDVAEILFNNVQSEFGYVIIQLGLIEIFKTLEIEIKDVYSIFEVVKLFAKSALPVEEFFSSLELKTLIRQVPINNRNDVNVLEIGSSKEDFVTSFIKLIGSLYRLGHNPQIAKLYPKIEAPVSRGTPMIAPLIKWAGSNKKWHVVKHYEIFGSKTREIVTTVHYKEPEWQFIKGHLIDGRNLFPATGYLALVWDALARTQFIPTNLNKLPVVFENCKFIRATQVPTQEILELRVTIHEGSGKFEITEGGTPVVQGRAFVPYNIENYQINCPSPSESSNKDLDLTNKDIYKELRLRGYNYTGVFRGLLQTDIKAQAGLVQWHNNWISFMDNMLQMKILQLDSRLLYVPTFIQSVSIDPCNHLSMAKALGEEPKFPVYAHEDCNIIQSGAIEIRGLIARSIARRKLLGQPVLEKYVFVPNEATLTLQESLRANLQIILENTLETKVKAVELIDEATESKVPTAPIIQDVLQDLPLIQPDVTILSSIRLDSEVGINIRDGKLSEENNLLLVVGSSILQRIQVMQQVSSALSEDGFILSREPFDFQVKNCEGLKVLTTHLVGDGEKLVLLRKCCSSCSNDEIINADDTGNFEFLPELRNVISSNNEIVIYSQNALSGVLGLINCIRREPNGKKIRCVLTLDKDVPNFNPKHVFYQEILNKKLAISVYKDGQWGTYRHLLIGDTQEILSEHCFANVTSIGDLSTLRWIEGPLTSKTLLNSEQFLIKTYYSALNFKDVMIASGRINADATTTDRLKQECSLGMEFSGRNLKTGRRVMGFIESVALSNLIAADSYFTWTIPDSWSLKEAATVPCVYATLIYALEVKGLLKRRQSILVHSGSGAIGLAAINIALHYECDIFITVGSKEKKEFLLKNFPQLRENRFGNSRDTSFEAMIKRETNGRGVDIVINSLAQEKLTASVRCLAPGGHFVEIGKFDMAENNPLYLPSLEKGITFHGVMMDQISSDPALKKIITSYLEKGISQGYVKPLPVTVFKRDEVQQAFRFMATGKHIGKILLEINEEEREKIVLPTINLMRGHPRYYCNSDKVQIIVGGLGGFGLELADWLVLQGSRKLLLASRYGVKNGYQAYRLRLWRSYGVQIEISTANISSETGCRELLETAIKIGEVESIFNLAVVLKDAIMENQTQDGFEITFGPKARATNFLDQLSRALCPKLRDFVVFSSVSCGRGNAGQTNYGMANSVMERICEKRQDEGYPALAVQWGAVADVGLVAEMQEDNLEMVIGGTLPQRVSNCLDIMHTFLRQDNAVVSSMVVAEKRTVSDSLVGTVATILGVRDMKTISLQSTLAEIGMDSMTAVEIKTTLEREFEVFLTPEDIRLMTFARLQEIDEKRREGTSEISGVGRFDFQSIRTINDEITSKLPIVHLPHKDGRKVGPRVILFPGMEGVAKSFECLTSNLYVTPIGVQYSIENPPETIPELAKSMLPIVEEQIIPGTKFHIIAYSYGTVIALELASYLESKGYIGTIFCIDGSPHMCRVHFQTQLDLNSEALFQTNILCGLLFLLLPREVILKNYERILNAKTFDERLDICEDTLPSNLENSAAYYRKSGIAFYRRLKALGSYEPSFAKLKSKVVLLKPQISSTNGLPEDYGLGDLCSHNVDVKVFEGDHLTILENLEAAKVINDAFAKTEIIVKDTIENKNVFSNDSVLTSASKFETAVQRSV